ncbi:hypothetical protein G6F42_023440 [Rhizopus arrhizus]|nr:hypothetical protein G6F42_023440 [Rhizopus arrhizus]
MNIKRLFVTIGISDGSTENNEFTTRTEFAVKEIRVTELINTTESIAVAETTEATRSIADTIQYTAVSTASMQGSTAIMDSYASTKTATTSNSENSTKPIHYGLELIIRQQANNNKTFGPKFIRFKSDMITMVDTYTEQTLLLQRDKYMKN